ncbi:MAG: hypothetical protein V2A73_07550 [Pseudomonadota bacterium]
MKNTRNGLTALNALALALAASTCQTPSPDGKQSPGLAELAGSSGETAGIAVASYPLGSLDWHLNDTIEPPVVEEYSFFGQSLDLDGSALIVGATQWTDEQKYYGAEIYLWNGTEWYHKDTLKAEINEEFVSNYAWDVAISGNIAAVGAPNEDNDDGDSTGAVFIFQRNEQGAWSFSEKLISSYAGPAAWFGSSVDLDGDTLLVGMMNGSVDGVWGVGSAHVFSKSTQIGRFLEGPRLLAGNGVKGDHFGISACLDGNTAVVGAPRATAAGVGSAGAVYVFRNDGSSWERDSKLWASVPEAWADFGASVAIDGDSLIVGADGDSGAGGGAFGAAYVFTRSEELGWQLQQRIVPATGYTGVGFGHSVAIRGNLAAIGASGYGGTDNTKEGAAYIFARYEDNWTQIAEFQAPNTTSDDYFGSDIVLDQATAIVGADSYDYNKVKGSGAAFSFTFIREKGTPCDEAEECSTGFCVDGVCCDSACGNGDPSDCQACSAARGATEDGTCTLTTTVCRPSRDGAPCDAPEVCDGKSVACPEDVLAGPEDECRPAGDSCDLPELCTLGTDQCPSDKWAGNGTDCEEASPCLEGGKCQDGVCRGGSFVLVFTPASLTIYTVQEPKIASQTVENKGALQDVVFTGASTSPAESFEIVSPAEWPLTLSPGASATLQIRFVPAAAGTKTGNLYLEMAGCDEKMLPLVGIAEKDPVSPASDAALSDAGLGTDAQSTLIDAGSADAAPADGALADAASSDVDAQPRADGAPSPDSGSPANVDAVRDDAGRIDEPDDSGCGCSVGQSTTPFGAFAHSAWAPLCVLLVVLAVRRRART